jgi:pimeloyl-ACP methyl ester carboxylesterase
LQAFAQMNREQKVDIGGYGVFTSQAGSREPVVVFEAGLGEDTSTWDKVLPKVAQFSHTLAYDRAGLGKSDSSPNPKSVEQMVKELHAVLDAAHVSPPYILVGHSLGGAICSCLPTSTLTRQPASCLWTPKMAGYSIA